LAHRVLARGHQQDHRKNGADAGRPARKERGSSATPQ
jgi:hypothetical protein